MHLVFTVRSPEETEAIAQTIGKHLRGGEIIELNSDLGGGKTTFTRGLARGAGSKDVVSSPTFTISKVYEARKFQIHHFDFYRLQEVGLIAHELEDALNQPDRVTVLEWSDTVRDVLPAERIQVTLTHKGDYDRQIDISCPDSLKYTLEDLC